MGFLLIGKIKVLIFFRVAFSKFYYSLSCYDLICYLANYFLVAKLLSEPLLQSRGIYFFDHFFALYSIFFQGVEQYSSRL